MIKPMKKIHLPVMSKFTSQFTSKKLMIACKTSAAVRTDRVFMQQWFRNRRYRLGINL